MVPSRFWHVFVLLAVAIVGVLMLSCGGEEKAAETPAATQPAGAKTPSAEKVPGVTDTEILIGAHVPLSQSSAAVFAPAADAMRAYYDYVNSQGGVYGRKITFLAGDDHYNAADAVEVVRKLVEQDGIFAMVGSVGPNAHMAVYRYLEDQGVPDLWIGGGLLQFTEPVVKSRFQGSLDYSIEGRFIARYIAETYEGKRLGLLVQNDEAGAQIEAQLREALEGSDVEIVGTETCELTDTDLTPYAQRLKSASPDVVAILANAGLAAGFVKVSRDVVAWDVPFVNITTGAGEIVPTLAGSENTEGLVTATSLKMASETDDPGIQRHKEIMQQFAPDVPVSTFTVYGQTMAELFVKALENAGPDLTRASLIEGAEAIRDFCCSVRLAPANLGPDDHRPFETIVLIQWQAGQWVQIGKPISFESTPGEISTCEGHADLP